MILPFVQSLTLKTDQPAAPVGPTGTTAPTAATGPAGPSAPSGTAEQGGSSSAADPQPAVRPWRRGRARRFTAKRGVLAAVLVAAVVLLGRTITRRRSR